MVSISSVLVIVLLVILLLLLAEESNFSNIQSNDYSEWVAALSAGKNGSHSGNASTRADSNQLVIRAYDIDENLQILKQGVRQLNWTSSSLDYDSNLELNHARNICIIWLDNYIDHLNWYRLMFFNSSINKDCIHPDPNIHGNHIYSKERSGSYYLIHYEARNSSTMTSCFTDSVLGRLRQTGLDSYVLNTIGYTKEPTLMLTSYTSNPGHQFWDAIWAMLPHTIKYPQIKRPFNKFFIPFVPECTTWMCIMAEYFFKAYQPNKMKDPNAQELVHMKLHPKVRTHCFDELYFPRFTWMRIGFRKYNSRHMEELKKLRSTLEKEIKTLQLSGSLHPSLFSHMLKKDVIGGESISTNSSTKRKRILFYDHTSTSTRHWINGKDVASELRRVSHNGYQFDVLFVKDFGALKFMEQCQLFNEADILVMTHGAQLANAICCRPGTWMLEIYCRFDRAWMYNGGKYHDEFGFNYFAMAREPDCYDIVRGKNWTATYVPIKNATPTQNHSFKVDISLILKAFGTMAAKDAAIRANGRSL